ncbi:MAG: hypothetical protein Q8Q14_13260 [Gemmatimonadales bacterium]|nr:hypothetical protein [Gemmatimonadales bacterium]
MDDSLLLVVGSPIGADSKDQLTLLRAEGSMKASFFNRRRYYEGLPPLTQYSQTLADGTAGCVFASSSRDDSVFAFDYEGRLLAHGRLDLGGSFVTLKQRLREHDGQVRTAGGGWVFDGDPVQLKMVAIGGCRAVVQVAIYHAQGGIDPLDGGTVILLQADSGRVEPVAKAVARAGLIGRDREGTPVFLRYTGTEKDAYVLSKLDIVASRSREDP